MKRNLLYSSIIIFLLLLIIALIIILYNRPKVILTAPIIVEKGVITKETKSETEIEPAYPEFLRYGIKPKEAKYYE